MPLADALIAQVVPVVSRAIEMNGPAELLGAQVTVPQGMNRRETLKQMARAHHLGIMLQGGVVSLASGNTPGQFGSKPANLESNQITAPATPVKVTKVWHIDQGQMLSTAMLDWATQWNWKLIWKADIDFRIAAPVTLEDNFLEGVGQMLDAYKNGDRPLWGDWNETQKVLVISEPSRSRR